MKRADSVTQADLARRNDSASAIAWLRTSDAISERAGLLMAAAERDDLEHFRLDPDRLEATAGYVIDTIRANYPSLDIPYHSRWRHFAVGGRDRWQELSKELDHVARLERARIRNPAGRSEFLSG